jgi:gliding motility-associated-like protein
MASVPGGALYIHQNSFTVVQHHPEDQAAIQDRIHGHSSHDSETKSKSLHQKDITLRSHAYEVQFVNTNPKAQVIADKPLAAYSNYFIGNDPSKWASGCKIYQGVTIENLYPNIDVRYYADNGQMKYDLIVKPGGDVSRIALQYKGAEKLEVKNKELVIQTSVGNIKELQPYTFQYNMKGKQEIGCKYVLDGNTLRFDVKKYDPNETLIIDPTLIFVSFSGSRSQNWGYTATYGPDGSMYGGGIVQGAGFPLSTGAYQQNYGGGDWDIGIIKLTPDGSNMVYSTYVGGNGIEQPHSLIVDPQGNLVIAGRSNSSNYPVTGTPFSPGGNYDIIVTKLNADGTGIIGSKKLGGTSDDGVNISSARTRNSLQYNYGDDGRSEVILDGGGNIYVASCTQSNSVAGISGSKGAQDGIILKLTPDVSSLLFATYIGGTKNDAAYVLSINPLDGNIYVGGGTESTDFQNTSGNKGSIDGFVSILTPGGSVVRSIYVGTNAVDQVYGLKFDIFGFPYIMGQTTGDWIVENAQWSQPGGKQFIVKLEKDLSRNIYSTCFGTSGSSLPNISPTAFLVDRCENVYVSGWGGVIPNTSFTLSGTRGLSLVNPLKPDTDGQDFYFFVLKKNATSQLYGDFFGQNGGFTDHVDGGTSRFDANGIIYQASCANCSGGAYPTTPGAWATKNGTLANGSVSCNLSMVKIDLNLSGIRSGIQSSINGTVRDTAGCVPLKVDFRDTILSAVSYEWDFGDGSPQIETKEPSASHVFTRVGNYRVMLVAIDPSTCNVRDTSYMTIKVGDLQANLDFNWTKLDPCENLSYQFTNLSTAPASHPFKNNSFMWDFGDKSPMVSAGSGPVTHRYAAPGRYIVKLHLVDTTYCNAPEVLEKTISVSAVVTARFRTPPAGCAPYKAVFENTSDGGQQFFWDFGDGGRSTELSPVYEYKIPGTYTVTLRVVDQNTCNKEDQTSFTITVFGKPVADFSVTPQPPVVNTPITFTNLSSAEATRFKWFFGDGDSLLTNSRNNVQHEFNETKKYTSCLIAYNANNCADTICREVEALVDPAIDVPNAFTPLSGGVNSVVRVRGFGIGKMKFIIWNRWGQKVFETDNYKIGWDGKFKGVIQPMDVYAYTLEVEFIDGTKASKKGDITLIR